MLALSDALPRISSSSVDDPPLALAFGNLRPPLGFTLRGTSSKAADPDPEASSGAPACLSSMDMEALLSDGIRSSAESPKSAPKAAVFGDNFGAALCVAFGGTEGAM
jgi:hypothetical protein